MPNPRCLCPDCYAAYVRPDGTLPPWLRAIQREAKRLTMAEGRNRERIVAGQTEPPRQTGRGGRRAYGVTFVPLSEIE